MLRVAAPRAKAVTGKIADREPAKPNSLVAKAYEEIKQKIITL